LNLERIPLHVAMIMDGNGRWAKKRGAIRLRGHRAGADTVERVLGYCEKYGVRYLTLYAFSTENWSRPKAEVDGLMNLLSKFLKEKVGRLVKSRCRFRAIGRIGDLSPALQRQIADAEEATKGFERNLILCLSYGGQAEIVDAARSLAADAAAGRIRPEDIDERLFATRLYAPDVPPPDLILRTSGEFRLSNFLLWEAAYSELYVTPVLWPDFGEDDFVEALRSFASRTRKFGGLADAAASEGKGGATCS
jgi:undecaprenyl diphosphate synthase